MVSMEGAINGPLLTLNTPTSATAKRGTKRSAPDSDEPRRPDSPLSQQPRVGTGMLAFIPETVWEYGSKVVLGLRDWRLLDISSSKERHAGSMKFDHLLSMEVRDYIVKGLLDATSVTVQRNLDTGRRASNDVSEY